MKPQNSHKLPQNLTELTKTGFLWCFHLKISLKKPKSPQNTPKNNDGSTPGVPAPKSPQKMPNFLKKKPKSPHDPPPKSLQNGFLWVFLQNHFTKPQNRLTKHPKSPILAFSTVFFTNSPHKTLNLLKTAPNLATGFFCRSP